MKARFEALFVSVLTAASNLGCIFFRILTYGLEQCETEGNPESTGFLKNNLIILKIAGWSLKLPK